MSTKNSNQIPSKFYPIALLSIHIRVRHKPLLFKVEFERRKDDDDEKNKNDDDDFDDDHHDRRPPSKKKPLWALSSHEKTSSSKSSSSFSSFSSSSSSFSSSSTVLFTNRMPIERAGGGSHRGAKAGRGARGVVRRTGFYGHRTRSQTTNNVEETRKRLRSDASGGQKRARADDTFACRHSGRRVWASSERAKRD